MTTSEIAGAVLNSMATGDDFVVGVCTLATITVTYNPDLPVLAKQIDQLPAHALKILVDNASGHPLRTQLRELISGRNDIVLVENASNVGLAAALNQGARKARELAPECRYLILLDQDTEPGENGVEQLLTAFRKLSATQPKLGCIGPRMIDVTTGLEHGFHQISGLRWIRHFPSPGVHEPVPVANLNGSGTLLPADIFFELGGLDESFFIDHVDTEWAFRATAAGYKLFGIPDVCFLHRMGETSMRFWLFGWHVWPNRSPLRHYFLFRNAVRLMRMPYVPLTWKRLAPVKLLLTFFSHLLFDRERWTQVGQMMKGMRDGLRG